MEKAQENYRCTVSVDHQDHLPIMHGSSKALVRYRSYKVLLASMLSYFFAGVLHFIALKSFLLRLSQSIYDFCIKSWLVSKATVESQFKRLPKLRLVS